MRRKPLPDALAATNRAFYDLLWSGARLTQANDFNTWPLVRPLLPTSPARLELGPGLRPRLPLDGTVFLDLTDAAAHRLRAHGAVALTGDASALPFRTESFDLVCACDVVEHVTDDRAVFREVSRVLKDGGALLVAVPLHRHLWTEFDAWVGHARRYDPAELLAIIAEHDLALESSAAYGMQLGDCRWLRLGMWYLTHRPIWAMFWYNWVGMPIALARQRPLQFVSGLNEHPNAAELLLICRRRRRG